MLGRLLEFAVHAEPTAETIAAYDGLGFESVPVEAVRGGPYAAMCNEIVFGLRAEPLDGPAPVFVRPDLKMYVRGLRHLGIELELAELADDDFNRAAFRDPSGRLVLLVEARTFSPPPPAPQRVVACGHFLEWSAATHSVEDSERFWAALGLEKIAAGLEPHPWVRMAGRGIVAGFHETARFSSALTFAAPGIEARIEFLQAKNLHARHGAPVAAPGEGAATVTLPEKTLLYLLDRAP